MLEILRIGNLRIVVIARKISFSCYWGAELTVNWIWKFEDHRYYNNREKKEKEGSYYRFLYH